MKIYHYDPVTKEYLSQTFAKPDPLEEGRFLVPANATDKVPPEVSANEVAVFKGGWSKEADFRGKKYWDSDGDEFVISEIGSTVPDGYADTPRPSDEYEWDGSSWVKRPITLQQVKDEASRRIIAICPEWKQRNLTAQASILAEKGRANWTAEELAAWEAGEALWSEIAAIRAKSDELEAMDPIPFDYTEDKWWT